MNLARPATIALFAASTALAQDGLGSAVRSVEGDDGVSLALETVVWTMSNPRTERDILLVGVTHIGEADYYDDLQELLDDQATVLFEGVKPGWIDVPQGAGDGERAAATEHRVRHIAAMAVRCIESTGKVPDDVAEAVRCGGEQEWIDQIALTDAWGNAIVYARQPAAEPPFRVVSFGADGQPGGDGPDADIDFAHQPPLDETELDPGGGIQADLATLLGLEFQLDAIDYNQPSWINSDVTMERLMSELAGQDPDAAMIQGVGGDIGDPFAQMMGAEAGMLEQIGPMMRMLGAMPGVSTMLRVMMIEMLASADELLPQAMEMMEEQGGVNIMDVLLDSRNDVVLDDLERTLDAPGNGSIALFYGAAHLAGFREALEAEGWTITNEQWLPAIAVEPGDGVSADQIRQSRQMMHGMRQMMERLGDPNNPFGGLFGDGQDPFEGLFPGPGN